MPGVDISTDAVRLVASLTRLQTRVMPKVKSIAAEKAARSGAKAAAASGRRKIEDPIKAVFDGRKGRKRLGWLYFDWDDRNAIRAKNGNVEAFVQLQGFASDAKAREEMQEALHRQIYGTVEREGVTPATPFIIAPSKTLQRKKRIRGCPIRINAHGNIQDYRRNLTKALARPDIFFQVKIGERGGGRRNNGLNLPPGLYMRKLAVRRYKRHRLTKRKGGPYNGSAKRKYTKAILTILTYKPLRDFDARWEEYPRVTASAMNDAYTLEFSEHLSSEVRRLLRG